MRHLARCVVLIVVVSTGARVFPVTRSLAALVPWKVLEPDEEVTTPLVLYWIPPSADAVRRSPMLTSNDLTRYSARCVAMRVVRVDDTARLVKLRVDEELPVAVLADGEGNVLGSVDAKGGGRLSVIEVESLVGGVLHQRELAAERLLDDARALSNRDDVAGALDLYRRVLDARCVVPRQAKAAEKAIRRLEKQAR